MPYLIGEPVGQAEGGPAAASPIPKASLVLRRAGIPSVVWGADAIMFRDLPFGVNYSMALFLLVPDPEKAAELLVRAGYSRAKALWFYDKIPEYQLALAAPPAGADEPAETGGEATRPLILLSADRFCYSLPTRPRPGDDVLPPYDELIISLFSTYLNTTEVEDIGLRDEVSLLMLQVYTHLKVSEILETLDLEQKLPTRFHRLHRDIVTDAKPEDFCMGTLSSWRATQYYVRMMEEDAKSSSPADGEAVLS